MVVSYKKGLQSLEASPGGSRLRGALPFEDVKAWEAEDVFFELLGKARETLYFFF